MKTNPDPATQVKRPRGRPKGTTIPKTEADIIARTKNKKPRTKNKRAEKAKKRKKAAEAFVKGLQTRASRGRPRKRPQDRSKLPGLTNIITPAAEITPEAISVRIATLKPIIEAYGMSQEEIEAKFAVDPVQTMSILDTVEAIERESVRLLMENKQYEDTHRIEYFQPFEHQKRFIEYVRGDKKTVLLVGANQIGKSVACANVAGAFSMGCKAPWDKADLMPSDYARMNNGQGIQGRILCNDWEKAAMGTLIPKLKEWLSEDTYETKKNNVGADYEFYFPKTKSKFTILTYKEDTKSHEGWTGDWVFADEPPPRDKYIANRRGLIARNGVFLMAMTAISEPWILDEIVLEPDKTTGIVADVPIDANTSLTPEAIRIFEQSLTEDEKVARIKGGWLQLTGRVWKAFYQQPRTLENGWVMCHVVSAFEIPPTWPVEFQIDFHLTEPHAISFTACDELGRYWVCEEVWQNCSTEELADVIIRLKRRNGWRLSYGEIDPLSKGDTAYIKNRFGKAEDSFTIIKNRLREDGIRLGVGSKDEKSYIKEVERRFKGVNGPNPTLYIMDTCKETIKQVSRWSYDDNGKPKADGHFPECIGRQTQTGLRYRPMAEEAAVDYAALKARLDAPMGVSV